MSFCKTFLLMILTFTVSPQVLFCLAPMSQDPETEQKLALLRAHFKPDEILEIKGTVLPVYPTSSELEERITDIVNNYYFFKNMSVFSRKAVLWTYLMNRTRHIPAWDEVWHIRPTTDNLPIPEALYRWVEHHRNNPKLYTIAQKLADAVSESYSNQFETEVALVEAFQKFMRSFKTTGRPFAIIIPSGEEGGGRSFRIMLNLLQEKGLIPPETILIDKAVVRTVDYNVYQRSYYFVSNEEFIQNLKPALEKNIRDFVIVDDLAIQGESIGCFVEAFLHFFSSWKSNVEIEQKNWIWGRYSELLKMINPDFEYLTPAGELFKNLPSINLHCVIPFTSTLAEKLFSHEYSYQNLHKNDENGLGLPTINSSLYSTRHIKVLSEILTKEELHFLYEHAFSHERHFQYLSVAWWQHKIPDIYSTFDAVTAPLDLNRNHWPENFMDQTRRGVWLPSPPSEFDYKPYFTERSA
jgi:hypothetical protein